MEKSKSPEYWEERVAANTWKTYNSMEERNRKLLEFYQDASRDIRNELYDIAEKYSKDGVLSRTDMYNQRHYEKLQKRFEDIILSLGRSTEKTSLKSLQDGFREVYKDTAVGMGDIDYAMPNKKLMEKLLEEPWRGGNFSNRLWKNQKKLVTGLNDILRTGLQQGKTVTEMAVNLHNYMGQGFNECHRLVRSESMHYLNSAAMQRYKDAGVGYVQIWAALDERTCEICGVNGYHGKVYPIDKCPVLPFHPNCRCTIIPCFDEKLIKAANEAERNTNKHVEFREDYDYTVKVNTWSEDLNSAVSRCAREVAKKGTADGNEHMYLIHAESGESSFYEKGLPGEVGGEAFWKFLDSHKEDKFIFVHNHNTDGYFSETDMRTLLREKQISAMIAVRNDAVIYVAEKGEDVPKSGYFDDLFRDELDDLTEKIRKKEISEADRNIKREEIIVDGLIQKYTKAGKLVEINGQK